MDEYIGADNDFSQRREEAYRYSEMTRASEEDSTPGMPEQSPIPIQMMAVTEPPKSLGPPTVVLVQRTSNNPVDAPDHSTSSVSVSFTFPKSVSPVTQILQHIGGTNKWKQLQ
jgi:hypothetical protein